MSVFCVAVLSASDSRPSDSPPVRPPWRYGVTGFPAAIRGKIRGKIRAKIRGKIRGGPRRTEREDGGGATAIDTDGSSGGGERGLDGAGQPGPEDSAARGGEGRKGGG